MILSTTIPHAGFGGPECCGCLDGIVRGDEANLVCNECGALVRSVPAGQLTKTLAEMELETSAATARCPHFGAVNLVPGLSQIRAFVCSECGRGSIPP